MRGSPSSPHSAPLAMRCMCGVVLLHVLRCCVPEAHSLLRVTAVLNWLQSSHPTAPQ